MDCVNENKEGVGIEGVGKRGVVWMGLVLVCQIKQAWWSMNMEMTNHRNSLPWKSVP